MDWYHVRSKADFPIKLAVTAQILPAYGYIRLPEYVFNANKEHLIVVSTEKVQEVDARPNINEQVRQLIAQKKPVTTFVWCLKNRPFTARRSIASIVNSDAAQFIHFEIVEDVGRHPLNINSFANKHLVNHTVVATGDNWNRSKLLNYGIRRATTPLVTPVDVDLLFPEDFLRTYLKMLLEVKFDTSYLWVSCTETSSGVRRGVKYNQYDEYSGFYTYSRDNIAAIGGYDESFVDYGHEERDLNWRFGQHTGEPFTRYELKHIVYHKSHTDDNRNISQHTVINLQKMNKHKLTRTVVLAQEWGNITPVEVKNVADRDVLVVMGNGPSLKDVDIPSLSAYDTIAMNGIYRYCYRTGWWPTYFCCFDQVVTECHTEQWKKMIEDDSIPTKQYFLMLPVSTSPKLRVLRPNGASCTFSNTFETFANGSCTGANAVQVGMCLGYKKFILIGIDANYVQMVDGAESTHNGSRPNELIIVKTPTHNPNYFCDDYQQAGDKYNVPNGHIYHVPAWQALAVYADKMGLSIVNCSPKSALTCFPKSTLEKELHNL